MKIEHLRGGLRCKVRRAHDIGQRAEKEMPEGARGRGAVARYGVGEQLLHDRRRAGIRAEGEQARPNEIFRAEIQVVGCAMATGVKCRDEGGEPIRIALQPPQEDLRPLPCPDDDDRLRRHTQSFPAALMCEHAGSPREGTTRPRAPRPVAMPGSALAACRRPDPRRWPGQPLVRGPEAGTAFRPL